jgi:hypothetical protein
LTLTCDERFRCQALISGSGMTGGQMSPSVSPRSRQLRHEAAIVTAWGEGLQERDLDLT